MAAVVTRKRRTGRRRGVGGLILLIAAYVFLGLLAVTTLAPFVIMLSVSLSPGHRELTFPLQLVPNPIGIDNYVRLFTSTKAARWLLNSFIVATTGTGMMLLTSSLAGYAFARGDFIGKNLFFMAFLGILMVPMTIRIIPVYMIMSDLNLINTYWALIGPWSASAFGTFLMRQQYASIPTDYDDAAIVDGASRFQVYYKVLLPQVVPGLVTLGVLRFMGLWNDFLYPMMLTSGPNMRTLTVGLATIGRTHTEIGAGFEMAGAVVGFLPTFLLFLIAQRYIVQGLTLSGVKG